MPPVRAPHRKLAVDPPGGAGVGLDAAVLSPEMERVRDSLRAVTRATCDQLDGAEIAKRPVSTVVTRPDAAPYVAIDFDRPALSDLPFRLNIWLPQVAEYGVAAEAVENAPELSEGIVVGADGFLLKAEWSDARRALCVNFLWRYLREGQRLDWDDKRFAETFDELCAALRRRTVVFHTTLPLSNLKMDIAELDFGDELKLQPASIEELERWLNPDRSLPPLGAGPPQWNTHYVDRPAVLHARQIVTGRPRPTDPDAMLGQLPRADGDRAVTALRLVLDAPITIIFQEHESEGLLAFGGRGTSWGWSPPPLGPLAVLDEEKATQIIRVWERLQTSPNTDFLRLPIRRWESSLLRTSLEDRLIDAWISLEALLLGGLEGELTYRAALRLAELLGASGTDRKAIYKAAKVSYGWRSKIVHGSRPKKAADQAKLAETVQITTEYVRSALLKVLDLAGHFDADKLDSDLLGRESRP